MPRTESNLLTLGGILFSRAEGKQHDVNGLSPPPPFRRHPSMKTREGQCFTRSLEQGAPRIS
eukprot:7670185-Alexandrium_andersonii.AAC.1